MSDCRLFPLLERAAKLWPDDVAQVRADHRLTFRQLKIAAGQLANELLQANIKPGNKIGLMCPNGPEYVIGSFALFLIDAVVVPIFTGLKELEVTALNADLRLDGVCYSPELEGAGSGGTQKELLQYVNRSLSVFKSSPTDRNSHPSGKNSDGKDQTL